MASATLLKAIWNNALCSGGDNPYEDGTDEYDAWQAGIDARGISLSKAANRNLRRKQDKRIIATIDAETDPAKPGRFMEPFAWGFFDGQIYREWWGKEATNDLVDYIRELHDPHIIYAHNGGKFDFQFIVKELEENVLFIGSRIASAFIKSNHFDDKGKPILHELRDSLSIIPVPLADAAEKMAFDYDKMETGKREKYKPEIREYLKQDCIELHRVVGIYRETFGNALTMASAAMKKLNEAMCPDGYPDPHLFRVYERLTPRQDADFRPFYFGGRVECFAKGVLRGNWNVYDIVSSYPTAMRNCLHPVGSSWEITRDITEYTDFALIDGFSNGALPVRQEDGSLAFPRATGTFHATIHEIQAGLETGRLKINRVRHARQCRNKVTFEKFIDTYFNLRQEAKKAKDDTFDLFWKLVMNGAYGKFAQNPEKFKDHILWTGGALPSREHGWHPEYVTDEYTIFSRKTELFYPGSNARSFLNVATGASITGAARARLLRGLTGAVNPIYCDTDSIICERLDGVEIGTKALGSWTHEAQGHTVAIVEKKLYCVLGENATDEKERAKRMKKYGRVDCVKLASKGVRLHADDIIAAARGEVIEHTMGFPTLKPDGSQTYITRTIKRRDVVTDIKGRQQKLRA